MTRPRRIRHVPVATPDSAMRSSSWTAARVLFAVLGDRESSSNQRGEPARYRSAVEPPRYDTIGTGYARTRREDPRLRARIHAALGGARTVVNVGAGAGSYEPTDRHVIAIEPSDVMAAQRPRGLAPALRGTANDLPLRDGAVDAAMAILTIHHWDEHCERGVRELRRV